ncbi:hypothetical protein Poli38472_003037 [Pythium oligandrum]|uniref:BCNT-C domain-containing protein n=1 Tax=Pythium oligandrum TaxID=41045 RepID=A0A8K1C5W9_PYTOL|nr:hypothetical protein Poli38472_003037 [Pythium oligandrum]|eukprot:TMW57112.1 hypothetical protein Poli38472_003037 [Pythium oligandrum]
MSSSEDDEDFVPDEAEEEETDDLNHAQKDHERSVESTKADPRVSKMWDDINASTSVSHQSADKTSKLLRALTSGKPRKESKKRKLREFKMPVLSIDVKKSRADIALAGTNQEVKEVVKFAGQEYSVSKRVAPVAKSKQKLDDVLASFEGPKKINTIEKTSIDWDKFKEQEGIEDELKQATKDGYIEKQEFLQRMDLKRFEIEKAERERQRQMRQQGGK